MESEELTYKLLNSIRKFQKKQFLKTLKLDRFNTNEIMILHMIYTFAKEEDNIQLQKVRDMLGLAPSTITSIITSLEEKELIERIIDKNDRRNICLNVTDKGNKAIKDIDTNLAKLITSYVNYMGEEDIKKFIELIDKSEQF